MRVPGGGASCPSGRVRGRAHYPLAAGAGGAGVGTRHQPHSARFYQLALRAVGAPRACLGGAPLAWAGAFGVGRSPTPDLSSSRACGRGPLPTGCGCGGCRRGDPSPTPQRALLRAGFARFGSSMRVPGGGAPLAWVWGVRVGRSPTPDHLSFRACDRGPLPTGCGSGGCGRGDPATTPQRALLRARFARCGGGTRAPGGGASCLGVGLQGTGAPPPPTSRILGCAARAHYPLAMGTVCERRGPAVLGTLSRAAVPRVLCALPGLAAPGGRCGLAPVLVPWLWPAACLCGVPRGPALVRRSSSGPVALGAPVGFPVAVVPSPTQGAVAHGFTGWLRGARGGRPRTGLFVPAAGPCQGRGALRAPRRTRLGPRDGAVHGGSLRLQSWAACSAVVWRVWTRSLTRPVSHTVRLSTGDSAGAPGLFRVDANTAPFGSEDTTPGSRVRVRVLVLSGRVGLAGLPCAFWCADKQVARAALCCQKGMK